VPERPEPAGPAGEVFLDPMGLADVDDVLAIERDSFATPWPRRAFTYELTENKVAHLWVARAGRPAGPPAVVGYLCLWFVADEVHVTNLAVSPASRGRGIGRRLLLTLLAHFRGRGARLATLEVREGNDPARRLYTHLGFRVVGRRRGYYVDSGEDALVLEADLTAPGWNPAPRLEVS
jgi:ribosomal-protein-alanine N-acetyltransferase